MRSTINAFEQKVDFFRNGQRENDKFVFRTEGLTEFLATPNSDQFHITMTTDSNTSEVGKPCTRTLPLDEPLGDCTATLPLESTGVF